MLSVAYHPVELLLESAAIKLHFAYDSLIRGNVIENTTHGSAVWPDNNVVNNRVTGNRFVNTNTEFGAIFIELTQYPNLVDSNVIIGGSGAGVYEHDAGGVTVANNLIANVGGPAVRLRGNLTDRTKKLRVGEHLVVNNLIVGCETDFAIQAKDARVEDNPTLTTALDYYAEKGVLLWPFNAAFSAAQTVGPVREDFWGRALGTRPRVAGPFGEAFGAGQAVDLGGGVAGTSSR